MNIGCGIDIVEIARIQKSIEDFGDAFLQRIYTENEIEYCKSKKILKYQHFAARFAAKEAIFKAMSKVLDKKSDLIWQSIEIINDENGRPNVIFLDDKLKNKVESVDISISHCKKYAVSNVIMILK